MPENKERKYEDSYQERERLQTEYISVLKDIENFIKISQKDSEKTMDSIERYISTGKKIGELKEKERQLEGELNKMVIDFAGLPEGSNSRAAFEEESDVIRDEILEIGRQINYLYQELIKIIDEGRGLVGDQKGTELVLELKWNKLEETRQQLEKLDNE